MAKAVSHLEVVFDLGGKRAAPVPARTGHLMWSKLGRSRRSFTGRPSDAAMDRHSSAVPVRRIGTSSSLTSGIGGMELPDPIGARDAMAPPIVRRSRRVRPRAANPKLRSPASRIVSGAPS